MKLAFSHDWLNGMRGGEKCLEVLCELYPETPIYTLFCDKKQISRTIAAHRIHTSSLQWVPAIDRYYRYFLPLFPAAVESLKARNYDFILSFSHCASKGIQKNRGAFHLCYCFTPMRYAWVLFDEYFKRKPRPLQRAIQMQLERLRKWDLRNSSEVDQFVAISEHVRNRIRHFYDRDARVIYPPVDTDFYTPDPKVKKEDYYLVVSALVPYKKIDLVIETFERLKRPVRIIGQGPERAYLESKAGKNIRFLGWQSNEAIREAYRQARALIFPGEEDFGIVPVEAQACGTPVIAFRKGGALETIVEGQTGVFFGAQDAGCLEECVRAFELKKFDPDLIRFNALKFSRPRFAQEMRDAIRFYAKGRL